MAAISSRRPYITVRDSEHQSGTIRSIDPEQVFDASTMRFGARGATSSRHAPVHPIIAGYESALTFGIMRSVRPSRSRAQQSPSAIRRLRDEYEAGVRTVPGEISRSEATNASKSGE
jgi:hypothetical protein